MRPKKVILTDGTSKRFLYEKALETRDLHLERYYTRVIPMLIQVFEKRLNQKYTYNEMAEELSSLGVRTAFGRDVWGVNSIRRLYLRWRKNLGNPRWFSCY